MTWKRKQPIFIKTLRDYDCWVAEEFLNTAKTLSDHTTLGDYQAMQFVLDCWFVLCRCQVLGIDPTDAVLGAVPFDGGVAE